MNFSNDLDQPKRSDDPGDDRALRRKRMLDALLIVLAMPLLIPLAIVVSLSILASSRGPVLFVQERVGFRGKRFDCFKFRSMHVDVDSATHRGHLLTLMNSNIPMEKMDSQGDPRIIRFGRFLRASGLDELPQVINVLRGEMSLVGPRPCLPYEYEQYLPWQRERFETVPGLTGLWQVSGKNRTTFGEMIALDITYTNNKTLWWDLRIILQTVPALAMQMFEARRVRKSTSRKLHEKDRSDASRPFPNSLAAAPDAAATKAGRAFRSGRQIFPILNLNCATGAALNTPQIAFRTENRSRWKKTNGLQKHFLKP